MSAGQACFATRRSRPPRGNGYRRAGGLLVRRRRPSCAHAILRLPRPGVAACERCQGAATAPDEMLGGPSVPGESDGHAEQVGGRRDHQAGGRDHDPSYPAVTLGGRKAAPGQGGYSGGRRHSGRCHQRAGHHRGPGEHPRRHRSCPGVSPGEQAHRGEDEPQGQGRGGSAGPSAASREARDERAPPRRWRRGRANRRERKKRARATTGRGQRRRRARPPAARRSSPAARGRRPRRRNRGRARGSFRLRAGACSSAGGCRARPSAGPPSHREARPGSRWPARRRPPR